MIRLGCRSRKRKPRNSVVMGLFRNDGVWGDEAWDAYVALKKKLEENGIRFYVVDYFPLLLVCIPKKRIKSARIAGIQEIVYDY